MFRILINFIDGSQADAAPVTLCYRIDFLLGKAGSVMLTQGNIQGTYHEVNFTWSGTIQSWIFGGFEFAAGLLYPELQIWRQDGGDGLYIKV